MLDHLNSPNLRAITREDKQLFDKCRRTCRSKFHTSFFQGHAMCVYLCNDDAANLIFALALMTMLLFSSVTAHAAPSLYIF